MGRPVKSPSGAPRTGALGEAALPRNSKNFFLSHRSVRAASVSGASSRYDDRALHMRMEAAEIGYLAQCIKHRGEALVGVERAGPELATYADNRVRNVIVVDEPDRRPCL